MMQSSLRALPDWSAVPSNSEGDRVKAPDARPRTAAELITRLDRAEGIEAWSEAEAKRWWAERGPAVVAAACTARATEMSSRSTRPARIGRTLLPRTLIELEGELR